MIRALTVSETNSILTAIHAQRSTHGDFLLDAVPMADQETILAASVRAPSASNRQVYSIIVLEDQAVMKELLGYQAGLALVFCNDTTRMDDLAQALGTDYPFNPTSRLMTGIFDVAVAAQNAALAATALGWGTLFTNCLHRGDLRRAWRLLGLPEKNCLPVITLLIGRPKHEHPPKSRWHGPGLIHRGRYQRLNAEEIQTQIAAYDQQNQDWQDHPHFLSKFFADAKRGGPAHDPNIIHPIDQILTETGFTQQPMRKS